jgi:PEP-CTERM motif
MFDRPRRRLFFLFERGFMRFSLVLGAASLAIATPANAGVTVIDNFDTEAGGGSSLNHTDLDNFEVTDGTIDVVRTPAFGITCAGGAGSSCIDLDGSTNDSGTIVSRNSYAFNAGDLITLKFDMSGNQRNSSSDQFFAQFLFSSPTAANGYTFGGAFGSVNIGNLGATNGISSFATIGGATGFQTYSLAFRAGNAGSLKFGFGQGFGTGVTTDNQGPLLDNVNFSIAAVPEPTTWAMLILGFGLIGSAVRQRKAATVRFATA